MKKMMLLSALICYASMALGSIDTDSIAPLQHSSLWHSNLTEYKDNPAFKASLYTQSYSELSASFHFQDSNVPFLFQKGSNFERTNFEVSSYLPLPSKLVVWGYTAYKKGKNKGIRFNSTSDFDRIYPYILGDTIGGNTKIEGYYFSGGTAFKAKQWTFGSSINFEATQEFRQTDPRMRGIVTNLEINMGTKYALYAYDLGFYWGAVFYKQTNDVEFYREEGVSKEYLFTGLGSNYVRFSGANRELYYKATGLKYGFDLAPKKLYGVSMSVHYNYVPYTQVLPKLNAFPLTTLYVSDWNIVLGWKNNTHRSWSVYGSIIHKQRLGDEHIAGDASGGEYKKLIDLTLYKQVNTNYFINAMMKWGHKQTFTTQWRIGYISQEETYAKKERTMNFSKLYGESIIQWQKIGNEKRFLGCQFTSSYETTIKKNITMPYLRLNESITQLVNHTYERFTSNYFRTKGNVIVWFYPRTWKKKGWFLSLEGETLLGKSFSQTTINTKVGVAF